MPGIIALVVSMGAATGAMLPFRSSLSLAAAALVFVLPVVGAMLLGGARVGLIGVVLGFVVLDRVAAFVGSRLQQLRPASARRAADSRRLLELSELLVADKPVREMLAVVASSVRGAFSLETVAPLLPSAE